MKEFELFGGTDACCHPFLHRIFLRTHRTYRISSYPQLEKSGVTASMHQRS